MSGRAHLALLDYGMGNRRSVAKALEYSGALVDLTRDPTRIAGADGLVVPGVGAFPAAMRSLRELGLIEPIVAAAHERKPVLGICLGMQLLFDVSHELETTPGLGLIPGEVRALETGGLRVPHIGWNEVAFRRPSPLTAQLPPGGAAFYHVHSLAAHPAEEHDVVGTTTYGETFATIVARDAVFGVQFHPEKSSASGLRMLAGFVELCRPAAPERAVRPASPARA